MPSSRSPRLRGLRAAGAQTTITTTISSRSSSSSSSSSCSSGSSGGGGRGGGGGGDSSSGSGTGGNNSTLQQAKSSAKSTMELNVCEALGDKENIGARLSGKRSGGGSGGCGGASRVVAFASPTNHSNNRCVSNLVRTRDTGDGGSESSSTTDLATAPAQENNNHNDTRGTPASTVIGAVSPLLKVSTSVTLRRLLPFSDWCKTSTDVDAAAADDSRGGMEAASATSIVVPILPYLSPDRSSPLASAVKPSTPTIATAVAVAISPPLPPQQQQKPQHVHSLISPCDRSSSTHWPAIVGQRRFGNNENDNPSLSPPVVTIPTRGAAAEAAVAVATTYVDGGEGTPYSGRARRVPTRRARKQPPSPLSLTPSRLYDNTATGRAGSWAASPLSASAAGGGDCVRHGASLPTWRRRLGMRCSSASKACAVKGRPMGATWEITPRGTRRLTSSRSSGGGGGVSSRGRELFKRTVFFPVEVEACSRPPQAPSRSPSPSSIIPRAHISLSTDEITTKHTSIVASAGPATISLGQRSPETVGRVKSQSEKANTGIGQLVARGLVLSPPAKCDDAVSREFEAKARRRRRATIGASTRQRNLRRGRRGTGGATTTADTTLDSSLEDTKYCSAISLVSCISPATSFSLSELGGEGGCGGWGRGLGGDSGGRGEVDVSCSSVDTAWSIASFDEWDREPTAREGAMSSGADPVARVLLDQSDDEHYPWTWTFRRASNGQCGAHSDQFDRHQTYQRESEQKQSEPIQLQQQPQPQKPLGRADKSDGNNSSSNTSVFQQQPPSPLLTPPPLKSVAHAGAQTRIGNVPTPFPDSDAAVASGNPDDHEHDRGSLHDRRRFATQHARANSEPEPAAVAATGVGAGAGSGGNYERAVVVANRGRTISSDDWCGHGSRRFRPIMFPS